MPRRRPVSLRKAVDTFAYTMARDNLDRAMDKLSRLQHPPEWVEGATKHMKLILELIDEEIDERVDPLVEDKEDDG